MFINCNRWWCSAQLTCTSPDLGFFLPQVWTNPGSQSPLHRSILPFLRLEKPGKGSNHQVMRPTGNVGFATIPTSSSMLFISLCWTFGLNSRIILSSGPAIWICYWCHETFVLVILELSDLLSALAPAISVGGGVIISLGRIRNRFYVRYLCNFRTHQMFVSWMKWMVKKKKVFLRGTWYDWWSVCCYLYILSTTAPSGLSLSFE